MDIKITTFNVENLFNRYSFLNQPWTNERYENFVMAVDIASIASRQGDLVAEPTTVLQRNNTALAIEDVGPDILVVQEIENIYTLRNFNHDYLNDYFDQIISIDGNDPRAIDVGLMLKNDKGIRVLGLRTHIDDAADGHERVTRDSRPNFGYFVQNAIFSRDCLEVDIGIGGTTLTLLINHFKAQDDKPSSSRRRLQQAKRVRELAQAAVAAGKKPIVLGDLNVDTTKQNYDKSLAPLFSNNILVDPFAHLGNDLWTHYYPSGRSISRLDYILLHPTLQASDVQIFRKGLTTKCRQYTGERYPTIGPEHTEASDHCPTSVVLSL